MNQRPLTYPDADAESRVRESFARQQAMATIGASISDIAPGFIAISFPFHEDLTQQHGFIHAGILSTVMDSACGFAALTLMAKTSGVLTVEFKINLMSPAKGDLFVAKGSVTKSGRTISVATSDMYSLIDGDEKLIASMTGTLMSIQDRPGILG